MIASQPCRLLPWDSKFFGFKTAQVNRSRLTIEYLNDILSWCDHNAIECLYFLADPDHPETVRLAENHGFRFVDIRVSLLRKNTNSRLETEKLPIHIRPCRPDDLPHLINIARISFNTTRFYADPGFSPQACSALYETWVRNDCHNLSIQMFIATSVDQIAGFISCQLTEGEKRGKISLIGVADRARGRGIGLRLVGNAVRWLLEQGAEEIEVVTQGRNVPALRMFGQHGFLIESVQLWYHKWFVEINPPESTG